MNGCLEFQVLQYVFQFLLQWQPTSSYEEIHGALSGQLLPDRAKLPLLQGPARSELGVLGRVQHV